tara:strand:- start:203 stop:463 length:261 start_codon:yes stop_codon:yes gene_type:complete
MKKSIFKTIVTSGNNQKVISKPILRDIIEITTDISPILDLPPVLKTPKEEPKIEIKMSGEPSLDKVVKELLKPKRTRAKKNKNEKS